MTLGDSALVAEVSYLSDGKLPFTEQELPVKNSFVHIEESWDEESWEKRARQSWAAPGDKKTERGIISLADTSHPQLAQSCETEDVSRQDQPSSMWRLWLHMLTARLNLKFGKTHKAYANDRNPAQTPAATIAASGVAAPGASAAIATADIKLPSVPCCQVLAAPRSPKKRGKSSVIHEQSLLDTAHDASCPDCEWKPGTALRLAAESETGSRAVTRALEVSGPDVRWGIASDFAGNVVELASDPNAIHALVSIVKECPEDTAVFVARELAGQGCEAAGHKYACRLICSMVQKRWKSDTFTSLIGEVLDDTERMWQVHYATYVFQELLKHGTPDQRTRILEGLITSLARPEVAQAIAQPQDAQVQSIFVLVSALTQCMKLATPLAQMLVGNASIVRGLAFRKYGFVLLRALLRYDGPERVQLRVTLRAIGQDQLLIFRERLQRPCKDCKTESRRCKICVDAAEMFEKALACNQVNERSDGFQVRA